MEIRLIPVEGLPNFAPGIDLAKHLANKVAELNYLPDHDPILCVAHKIVSKAEGRTRSLKDLQPSDRARQIARKSNKSAKLIQLILDYARSILHVENGTIIAETPHGFVCANAGVDISNLRADDQAVLLPEKPNHSAKHLSDSLKERLGHELPVIITDTWGRPWREGQVNFAIGVHGMNPIVDYRGDYDAYGEKLVTSRSAVADELAAAAELLMGKARKIPAVLVEGYPYDESPGTSEDLLRDPETDFFRPDTDK